LRLCDIFDFGTANKIGGKSSRREERDGSVKYHGSAACSTEVPKDVIGEEALLDSALDVISIDLENLEVGEDDELGSQNMDHIGWKNGVVRREEREYE
jgi:hypothetical protein